MSGPSRRALVASSRALLGQPAIRAYATGTPKNIPSSSSDASNSESPAPGFMSGPTAGSKKKPLSAKPLPMTQSPRFPVPADPFDNNEPVEAPKQYSDTRIRFVRAAARLMGYNTKAVTAIRETGRMMKSIVLAIERDRAFWYDECALPPTYQTFFQVHLLYMLILMPRLRCLALSDITPREPGAPRSSSPQQTRQPHRPVESQPTSPPSSPEVHLLSKAAHESYPTEIINHFFELAEAQMRNVLGKGERERVVQKYMQEMGQQWKGATTTLDYVLGLYVAEEEADRQKADYELACWIWRNLFSARGLAPAMPGVQGAGDIPTETLPTAIKDLDMVVSIEKVVQFMRSEMSRLETISDQDILGGNIGEWAVPMQ